MKYLNLIYKNKILIFFLVVFFTSLLKFFFVSPLNQELFLTNYKFFTPDSYDWIANGVQMFKSRSISFRNPGLPFIIFILYRLEVLYLLPLFNYIAFFVLLIFVYKTTRILTKEKLFSLLSVVFIFFNYSFQDFSNYIYADYYAVVFISISLYCLLISKNKLSFFTLSLSTIFQNFAFFLLPLWFLYFFIKTPNISYQVKKIPNYLTYFLYFLFLPSTWFLYKFILFGNPLYTKVIQFGLLRPNLNLLFYYLINAITLFGPILFLFFFKNGVLKKENKTIVIFIYTALIITFSFWTFLYYWADRRFLLYLIPFLYPIVFFNIKKLFFKTNKFKVFIITLLLIYPTTISIGKAHRSNLIPITNWEKLKFEIYGDESGQTLIKFPLNLINESYPIKYILFPALAEILTSNRFLINDNNTLYSEYKDLIDSYSEFDKCINKNATSIYEFSAILQIEKSQSVEEFSEIFCSPEI